MAYITGNGSSFQNLWNDLGDVNGQLVSQPASIAWGNSSEPRLDVFAVSSTEKTVYGRRLVEDGWGGWEKFGTRAASQPVLCYTDDDRIDVWTTREDSHDIMHYYWDPRSQEFTLPSAGPDTSSGPVATAPGVSCGNNTHVDLVWYDHDSGILRYNVHEKDTRWEKAQRFDGEFIGDPAIFRFQDDRVDFFGVQADHRVYHLSHTGGALKGLTLIGGNVTSVPSVISQKSGEFDVVALGSSGTVQHAHYDGTVWSEWEDLPFQAVSACEVVLYMDYIILLALGKKEVQFASWISKGESEWADSVEVKSIGGNPSLDFFIRDEE